MLFAVAALSAAPPAHSQHMMGLDITSDSFTKAEMSRAEIDAGLAALAPGKTLDLSGKSLNCLDFSGMDLRRVKLQSARINKTNFKGANLEGVILDQAWALKSDFTGANLKSSSLIATQLGNSKLDGADFSNALVAADFSNASVMKAKFDGSNLSADEKNQSMGLMRGAFNSTNLEGSTFRSANMARVLMEFASLRGSELAAVDLTGADVKGADFDGADLNGAGMQELKNKSAAKNLDKAKNFEKALID